MITLTMEAVHTSETSVNFNVTIWRYIPEDSKLHTLENLKYHVTKWGCFITVPKNDFSAFYWMK
jgi:hypothetical protein